jgi:hypothetical protein
VKAHGNLGGKNIMIRNQEAISSHKPTYENIIIRIFESARFPVVDRVERMIKGLSAREGS